ncbi:MAG TPA: cyclic pyranopterin monophosphate synthase MoaC [Polyangia bacterium]|nr:cyclic pyranopterin monophosphate synthase MoaC [Polyangia bacterium]
MSKLTHFDDAGQAHMVDVGAKPESERVAVAAGTVEMQRATLDAIGAGIMGKGDVLGIARVAAIAGLKRTAELIPLCHPVRVTGVDVSLAGRDDGDRPRIEILATVRAFDRTGVEMEALTAVSIAALTVYDMCKAVDRSMRIADIRLVEKRGGRSGTWTRGE